MTETATSTDRMRAILVIVATFGLIAFNFLATTGRINGVTPDEVFNKYSSSVSLAEYSFVIWSLIYAGLIAFSIYQLLPSRVVKYRNIRTFYILSCALNCGWVYFWLSGQVAVCFVIIILLVGCLYLMNLILREGGSTGEYWLVKAPFGIYFGWVTAVALVNFVALLMSWNVQLSETAWTILAVLLIFFATLLGVLMRVRLMNYMYPLAIAWALTGIAVKQSGRTPIVVAAAIGVIVCLIAALSFVVNLPSSSTSAGSRNE